MVSDEAVVQTASEAAENLIFDRIKQTDVKDFDVTVTFEEGILDVDVYVNAPNASRDEEKVANDAALAARTAVDDLFAEAEGSA